MAETIRDIYETLNDKQKQMVEIMVAMATEADDDDDEDEEDISHSELKHYGVLGMKWGIRKYQNPDGTLTPAGKKRYGEDGEYTYTSSSTKRLQKKVGKLERKRDRLNEKGRDTSKVEAKLKKKAGRLETSKVMDKNLLEYAKKTSTGKAVAQNLIFGPWGARGYQQARANGEGRVVGAAMGLISSGSILYNKVGRYGNRVLSETRRGESNYKLGNAISKGANNSGIDMRERRAKKSGGTLRRLNDSKYRHG